MQMPGPQAQGFPPNTRGPARSGDGGRRARYAATAKAPSWASSDWHPLKAVLASGAPAAVGTGVFLPHLSEATKPATATSTSAGPASSSSLAGGADTAHQPAAASGSYLGQQPISPRDGSPACSVDGVSICDPFSRTSTLDFSRGSTFTDINSCAVMAGGSIAAGSSSTAGDSFGPIIINTAAGGGSGASGPPSGLGAMAEEPEKEAAAGEGECDFSALARELADLMGRQAGAAE